MSEPLYNIADFKNQLGEVTAQLEAGETLLLAKRNVPFARVVPLGKHRNRTDLGFGKSSVKIHGEVESPAIPESDYECLDGDAPT